MRILSVQRARRTREGKWYGQNEGQEWRKRRLRHKEPLWWQKLSWFGEFDGQMSQLLDKSSYIIVCIKFKQKFRRQLVGMARCLELPRHFWEGDGLLVPTKVFHGQKNLMSHFLTSSPHAWKSWAISHKGMVCGTFLSWQPFAYTRILSLSLSLSAIWYFVSLWMHFPCLPDSRTWLHALILTVEKQIKCYFFQYWFFFSQVDIENQANEVFLPWGNNAMLSDWKTII